MKNELDETVCSDLWMALRDATGFEPRPGTAEWKGWRTILKQWAEAEFTPTDVRRAVRGYVQAHPLQPVTPWAINQSPMAYIALVTPRDLHHRPSATLQTTDTHGVIEHDGDVPPPPDLIRTIGKAE